MSRLGWSSESRSTTSTRPPTPVPGRQRRGESTIEAAGPDGDRRGGVVWHTQGSGKSVEMLLYAAKIMPARMGNPTLVFITDRNDLDDQLFGEVFAPARILPEQPRKADSRADVRQVLSRASLYEISECLLLTVPGLVELSHVGGSDEQEVDIGLLITLATGE